MLVPSVVTVVGIVNVFNLPEFWNAELPIANKFAGSVIDCRLDVFAAKCANANG